MAKKQGKLNELDWRHSEENNNQNGFIQRTPGEDLEVTRGGFITELQIW